MQTNTFGLRYVTAVASGCVVAADVDQLADCPWKAEAGKALVAFYDVTNTPIAGEAWLNPVPPPLLRVAIGPSGAGEIGHAFAVRAKAYPDGKTYIFVGDLLGRVFIVDVSGDTLFPAASVPYRRPSDPPANWTPVLPFLVQATESFTFAADPVDGKRPNLLDLEIDGDELYCALGRDGVAVLDLRRTSGSFNLVPLVQLDTPGLAQGLALRGSGANRQLLVGDSRSGLRLYGRTP